MNDKGLMVPKIVIIDQDECITTGGWIYLLNEFLGTHYKEEDFSSYCVEEEVISDPKVRDAFYQYILDHNMYSHAYFLPGAIPVLEKLFKSTYYRPYIVTSYSIPQVFEKCGILAQQKHDFFLKYMPFIPPGRVQLSSGDKSVFKGDVRIDDLVKHMYDAELKLLMTSFHNKDIPDTILQEQGITRVGDWYDVEKVLKL